MSNLTLVRRQILYLPTEGVHRVPRHMLGIYVLYQHRSITNSFTVHYIGAANGRDGSDIRTVLKRQHPTRWSHVSVYELWDNIGKDDHSEVEALFEHIYRDDPNLRAHRSKSLRCETFNNTFLPRELFTYFVKNMARI